MEKGSAKTTAAIVRPDDVITAYDERGRELRIKRSDWVKGVLGPALEQAWNDPNALSAQIVQALRDDFVEQVADAAERLVALRPGNGEALVLSAIVRMETGDLDGAGEALRVAIEHDGPSAVVLTNLANLFERRGDKVKWRATLHDAVKLDPNYEGALARWVLLAKEERGEAAYVSSLEELASLPGAWRPQLWLARARLKAGDREGALALYEIALSRAADPPDVLTTVTGDLGNAGALEDVVALGAPRYKPETHGPLPGLNLVQALKQLGRIDEARRLVRELQAMKWSPLAETLSALESELAEALPPKKSEGTAPQLGRVVLTEPLWTRRLFEPDWLFPGRSDADSLVGLFAFADGTSGAKTAQVQAIDEGGRLTRSLPLYLAESLGMRFRIRTHLSLFVSKGHGPAVFGQPSPPETLEPLLPGLRRIALERTRLLRELLRSRRGLAWGTRLGAPHRRGRDDCSRGVQVGRRRALQEDGVGLDARRAGGQRSWEARSGYF
jgi:tetratricopeptide (TPR) repeat protein